MSKGAIFAGVMRWDRGSVYKFDPLVTYSYSFKFNLDTPTILFLSDSCVTVYYEGRCSDTASEGIVFWQIWGDNLNLLKCGPLLETCVGVLIPFWPWLPYSSYLCPKNLGKKIFLRLDSQRATISEVEPRKRFCCSNLSLLIPPFLDTWLRALLCWCFQPSLPYRWRPS